MSVWHPSIYYINFKILRAVVYQNIFASFHWPRVLFTILFLFVFVLISFVNIVFRLFDELIFLGYRNIELPAPTLILSNPRSGTTFLQDLMVAQGNYHDIKLYETIFPSITIYKIVSLLSKADKLLGQPVTKLIEWLSSLIFAGWKDIHPTGINKTEEDEGIWFLSMGSPALCLLTPYYQAIHELSLFDELEKHRKRPYLEFYNNSIKRIQYHKGLDKPMLIKSVMGSGRILSYMTLFPDAQIINLNRDEQKTVASFVSMFSATWGLHSSDLSDVPEYSRALAECPIAYIEHLTAVKDSVKASQIISVDFKDFVSDPKSTLDYINGQLDVNPLDSDAVSKLIAQAKGYQSKHQYSTEL